MPPLENEEPTTVCLKPNPVNNLTMFKIFHNVQFNVVQHKKYVKEMTKLYNKMDEGEFRESFTNALYYLFTFGDTSHNVDRVIQFVATFCTTLNDDEEFLFYICELVFNCQSVIGQSVRYRASQLLAAVLSALGDDASLDNDLCDKLLSSQTSRLQDTRGAIRCRAAIALQRLQNPNDNEDPVTRAYRFHMGCDPSASVRRAIVMSLAKCIRNTRYVELRLCDVDEAVRRAAFIYFSSFNVTQLQVRQRLYTLKVGLNERSPRVRRVVEEILIPGWLAAFQGNIIDLLKAIRLDNAEHASDSQYVAGKLLESLFKRLPTSELLLWLPTDKNLRLIPSDKLNKETAWYWRHLAVHLQKLDDDETLEAVLPDLVMLTGYIRTIVEAPCPPETEDPVGFNTRQHVLAELARLLCVYDAGDPVGRNMLQILIVDVLTGDHGVLFPEVIKAFVSALELSTPDIWARVELISTVISELKEPDSESELQPMPAVDNTEIKLQRARLRVSFNVALEAQVEAARSENYTLAAVCKARAEEIQRKLDSLQVEVSEEQPVVPYSQEKKPPSPQNLKKCLLILNSLLDTPQITSITPQLKLIFKELELELFKNPDILETALETIALFSMLDREIAKEQRSYFFAHIFRVDDESLRSTILKCIIDILSVHGLKVFELEDSAESSGHSRKSGNFLDVSADIEDILSESFAPAPSSVIEILLKIMDGTHPHHRLLIVEGLCRLFVLGHLESPGIISRLILLWFNPITEEEDMLRQTIGIFFQTFPVTAEGAQEQIQKATLPTLRALVSAPSSSPISEIDQEAVVRFIVSLTKVNHELIDSQGSLAVLLVAYLVNKCGAPETSLICRMLSLLSPPRDVATCHDLTSTLRDICQKLPDKQSCRHLTRYLGALEISERTSLNKMSTGNTLTEASLNVQDLSARPGRNTTSLPQPIGRSTHVVVNDTVPEEPEIDESSPTDIPQSTIIPQDAVASISSSPGSSGKQSSSPDSATDKSSPKSQDKGDNAKMSDPPSDGSSSTGVTPAKKPRVEISVVNCDIMNMEGSDVYDKLMSAFTKCPLILDSFLKQYPRFGKRKLSLRQQSRASNEDKAAASDSTKPDLTKPSASKTAEMAEESPPVEKLTSKNKRSRSQRSPDSTDKQAPVKANEKEVPKKAEILLKGNDKKNMKQAPVKVAEKAAEKVTETIEKGNNKPTKKKKEVIPLSVRTRRSVGSAGRNSDASLFSSDEDTLHTIVYDKLQEQEVLNTSSDMDNSNSGKDNVTIPESPESSGESEAEPEPMPVKNKPKTGGKK